MPLCTFWVLFLMNPPLARKFFLEPPPKKPSPSHVLSEPFLKVQQLIRFFIDAYLDTAAQCSQILKKSKF